jgi:hypothetical protein
MEMKANARRGLAFGPDGASHPGHRRPQFRSGPVVHG